MKIFRFPLLSAALLTVSTVPSHSELQTNSSEAGKSTASSDWKARIFSLDHDRIRRAAEAALQREPLTITRTVAKLSEGGPQDYYSNGDYWWPDPKKPGGLPYIQRDGESNPDNFSDHRLALRDLRDAVAALGAAFLKDPPGGEKYAIKAAELLRVFFLDPATRMNPHLKYAQAIPGVSPGRGIGIIDTLHLIEIPKAVEALETSAAFPKTTAEGLREWFRDYARWMRESKNGQSEATTTNNHAVAFYLQLAVFDAFTGNGAGLEECRKKFRDDFTGKQMAADGSFPRETARTKPYAYSIFQWNNMATLCQVLSTPEENLWAYTRPDGRGIRKATEFLFPFLADKSTWPHPPDVQSWEGWPGRQPGLLFAGIALEEEKCLTLWKSQSPDPADPEIQRNIPITQPVLWLP